MRNLMQPQTVILPSGSSVENLLALAEVQDFATTETGHTYRILPEPLLTAELARKASPKNVEHCDTIAFQPCTSRRNQDRHVAQIWDLPRGAWTFTAIFDGHAGNDTVEYALDALPSSVRRSLHQHLVRNPASLSPDTVKMVLSEALVEFDNSIRAEFLDVFPGGVEAVEKLTDGELSDILDDGFNHRLISRCIQGTTAIIALVDPTEQNLWIANLGDCQAVLGTRTSDSSTGWSAELLNSIHDGSNQDELARISAEHPGEVDCIRDDRVIGFLAPTRALGDTWLKLPSTYTRRIFAEVNERHNFRKFADRILTPPYVSNLPDTYHYNLTPANSFVLLCSDGLPELYNRMDSQDMVNQWAIVVGEAMSEANASFRLLRDALGGDNAELVSRNLTLEMEDPWIDDITVIVQRFGYRFPRTA